MWSNKMDDLDADEEWSDDEYVRSKAYADKDRGTVFQNRSTASKHQSTSKTLTSDTDPIGLILSKIDAELSAIKERDVKISASHSGLDVRYQTDSPRSSPVSQHLSLPGHPQREQAVKQTTEAGQRSSSITFADLSDVRQQSGVLESRQEYHEEAPSDDERDPKSSPGIPRDLDPLTAQQVDKKFKEIMLKKKGKTADPVATRINSWTTSRPPVSMLSAGYGTDSESVRTEDFEAKFMGMMVPPSEGEGRAVQSGNTKTEPATLGRLTTEGEPKSQGFEFKPKSIMTTRPRSLSPRRTRLERKNVFIVNADNTPSPREKGREPLLIEVEVQAERRSRSVSPSVARGDIAEMSSVSDPMPQSRLLSARTADGRNESRRHAESQPHRRLRTMSPQTSVRDLQTISDQEMNTYTQTLHLMKKKLIEAQEEVKGAREMADKAKSELLSLEFKRGNVSQELGRLNNDISRRKTQVTALETEIQVKAEEAKNMWSLGVTRDDCLDIKAIKEENMSLKSQLRNVEGLQLERDELVRQLEATKEDLFREQKNGRAKMEELQEEMDNLAAKLEETESNWSSDQAQLANLEASVKKMERERNELLQEKVKQCEELKASLKEENVESQNRLKKELTELDKEVQELRAKVNNLQLENVMKDSLEDKLRSEINEMGAIIDRERQDKQRISSEQKKVLENLKKETGSAVLRLKESMFLEKQRAVEELKKQLEEDKRDATARNEERLMHILDKHSYQMEAKIAEISRLQDAISRLESNRQMDLEEQIIDAVQREREKVEVEKELQFREEKEEEKRRNNDLLANIDKEKQCNRDLLREITGLKKELEELRKQHREANKEKLMAVARAKDQMKEQGIAEIERIKFNLKQEHESEITKLKERLHGQEQEVHRVKSEMESVSNRERQIAKAMEHTERMVVAEIHKQCQRISSVTGVPVRGIPSSSLNFELPDGRQSPSFKKRPAINAALASLHGCIDDLQHAVSEMHQQLESLRAMARSLTKEKEEAIANCRLEMDRQRIFDLEKLKEKLLKDHVTEISNVITECAEANSQLKTNSEIMQRYGDAALLEALQAKDDELHTLQVTLDKWQGEMEEKFNTQLQLQVAREREKYQALQHHSTREQKRISDLQKREIDRLEKELQKIVSNNDQDSNRFVTSASSAHNESALPRSSPSSSSLPPTPAANIKSSQRYLQNRIEQLQVENDALRKQRMLNSSRLSWSTSNLSNPHLERPPPTPTRPLTPSLGPDRKQRLGERMRPGDGVSQSFEERANRGHKTMNNKMEEMAKLQNTLILQNQELQALERSYNDLHKHYLPRPGTPVRNLNTTL